MKTMRSIATVAQGFEPCPCGGKRTSCAPQAPCSPHESAQYIRHETPAPSGTGNYRCKDHPRRADARVTAERGGNAARTPESDGSTFFWRYTLTSETPPVLVRPIAAAIDRPPQNGSQKCPPFGSAASIFFAMRDFPPMYCISAAAHAEQTRFLLAQTGVLQACPQAFEAPRCSGALETPPGQACAALCCRGL